MNAGPQSIAASTYTYAKLDGEYWDTLGEFNLSTNLFTALATGKYLVCFSGVIEQLASGKGVETRFAINGGTGLQGYGTWYSSGEYGIQITISEIVALSAGNTLGVLILHSDTTARNLARYYTKLSIVKVQ
jgi:hypothetical protein